MHINLISDTITQVERRRKKGGESMHDGPGAGWLEEERIRLLYRYERALYQENIFLIAGVDEAGRGPLAGPVIAAAVILPPECLILGLDDSKKLSEGKRLRLEGEIQDKALAWAIGSVTPHEIDRINIYQAAMKAMTLAVQKLSLTPGHILVDAMTLKNMPLAQTAIIKGDAQSATIAAASILAKCHRDRLMVRYDERYPGYGFARHKGYGTKEHREAILRLGFSPIHRTSFAIKAPVPEDLKV